MEKTSGRFRQEKYTAGRIIKRLTAAKMPDWIRNDERIITIGSKIQTAFVIAESANLISVFVNFLRMLKIDLTAEQAMPDDGDGFD